MTIQTGNEASARPVLRINDTGVFASTDDVLYITDLTFNADNNLATYNTIDSLDTLKFATTSDRSISITFLRDSVVQPVLEAIFNDKTEAYFEFSPLGVAVGSSYKTGRCYITNLSENKTGTSIFEITASLDINGAVTEGTH